MDQEKVNQHLSQISTMWTVLGQAHGNQDAEAGSAQLQVLQRYGSAIYRYLMVSLRDADAADELFQDFALRFIRGDFQRADPTRGRFRNFLKTALVHLMIDYRRRQNRAHVSLSSNAPEPAVIDESKLESERQFLSIWRAELMSRTWEALADFEAKSGQYLCTVLRYRTDHPNLRSAEMAVGLSEKIGKTVTADWVRKRLHLAREKFTDLLLAEVARSIDHPTLEDIEGELIDLELLEHCRSALERRRGRAAP